MKHTESLNCTKCSQNSVILEGPSVPNLWSNAATMTPDSVLAPG